MPSNKRNKMILMRQVKWISVQWGHPSISHIKLSEFYIAVSQADYKLLIAPTIVMISSQDNRKSTGIKQCSTRISLKKSFKGYVLDLIFIAMNLNTIPGLHERSDSMPLNSKINTFAYSLVWNRTQIISTDFFHGAHR